MSKKENKDNNNNHEILEQGDIYFFYRPKKILRSQGNGRCMLILYDYCTRG